MLAVSANAKISMETHKMEIKRYKNRWLYNIACIVILIGFLYVFITHRQEITLNDYLELFTLSVLGFCAATRAFFLDRYIRLLKNNEAVDLWTFLNDLPILKLMVLVLLVRPFKKESSNTSIDIERTRKTVNYFSYLTYLFSILFILYLIFIQ
jgi:hypothetical protein